MPYDNENCQSCRYFLDVDFCAFDGIDKDAWPDLGGRCDHFTPSLECRKVRALEEIAEKVSGLEMNTRYTP